MCVCACVCTYVSVCALVCARVCVCVLVKQSVFTSHKRTEMIFKMLCRDKGLFISTGYRCQTRSTSRRDRTGSLSITFTSITTGRTRPRSTLQMCTRPPPTPITASTSAACRSTTRCWCPAPTHDHADKLAHHLHRLPGWQATIPPSSADNASYWTCSILRCILALGGCNVVTQACGLAWEQRLFFKSSHPEWVEEHESVWVKWNAF